MLPIVPGLGWFEGPFQVIPVRLHPRHVIASARSPITSPLQQTTATLHRVSSRTGHNHASTTLQRRMKTQRAKRPAVELSSPLWAQVLLGLSAGNNGELFRQGGPRLLSCQDATNHSVSVKVCTGTFCLVCCLLCAHASNGLLCSAWFARIIQGMFETVWSNPGLFRQASYCGINTGRFATPSYTN